MLVPHAKLYSEEIVKLAFQFKQTEEISSLLMNVSKIFQTFSESKIQEDVSLYSNFLEVK